MKNQNPKIGSSLFSKKEIILLELQREKIYAEKKFNAIQKQKKLERIAYAVLISIFGGIVYLAVVLKPVSSLIIR